MAYRLRENEEDAQSRLALDFDIILTPKTSVEDAVKALENMDNYGVYVSNMRNVASNKAIEMYFGNMDAKGNKISPATKASIERQRGEKFPLKTKDAIDAFVKSQTSKPNLLKYDVKGNTLVFPKGSNPAKDLTKKIIKTVMDSAGIDFTIKEKESVSEDSVANKIKSSFMNQVTGGKKGEPMSKGQTLTPNTKMKKSELKEMIKEEIKEVLNSSNWTISNIQSWINEYFSNKNMGLKLVDKIEKMDSAYGSKTMFYIYEVGEDHGLIIKSSQVAGAPRLNELDVIVGTKEDSRGKLTNTLKITNSTGNKAMLYDMFDKKFK